MTLMGINKIRSLLVAAGLIGLAAAVYGCAPDGALSLSSSSSADGSTSSEGKDVSRGEGIVESSLVLENCDDYLENDNLPSTGQVKLLVVPCRFEDDSLFDDSELESLEKAFFDTDLSSDEGCYYSLSEYYAASSYGKLRITGEVSDVLNIPYTVEEAKRLSPYLPGMPAAYMMEETSGYDDSFFQDYDVDSDGYVDGVCFIYSHPMDNRDGNFWAWTATFDTEPNLERPAFRRHMWCSVERAFGEDYRIDAHTFIHEAGHMFGLRDYYPSDNNNLSLGGHSMMDFNISDHDPYSKMLLGWVDPIYYEFKPGSAANIELRDFESTGDVLLLNASWNHTVMDEYLLVEFYTPTGLNLLDSQKPYENRPQGFTKPGIKIYHVDSRIAHCLVDEDGKLSFVSYSDEIPESKGQNDIYLIGASSNNADSYTDSTRAGRYKQISLVENKSFNRLQDGASADDYSLFYEGDVFSSADSVYLTGGKFNDKTLIGFDIEITSIGTSASLKVACTLEA